MGGEGVQQGQCYLYTLPNKFLERNRKDKQGKTKGKRKRKRKREKKREGEASN